MRVELLADVFTGDGFEPIATLIWSFSQSRHDWVVDPDQLPVMERYFREHAPTRAAIWSDMARKGTVSQRAWTAGPSRRGNVSVTRESLVDHVHDLMQSARFVVENREGDGDFALAIAHVFGATKVVTAKERGWLKFVQAGGSGEVPKVTYSEQEEFKRTNRVTFLLDSDRLTPEQPSGHEKAAHKLREAGIHGHILRFREVENYVPNRILAAASASKPHELTERIKHLKTLSREQRAHFDMKNGFADRRREGFEIHAEQEDLYRSLPEHTKVGLRLGFGEGLTQVLLREAEAGKLEESHFERLGAGVCDELRAILDLLHRIL